MLNGLVKMVAAATIVFTIVCALAIELDLRRGPDIVIRLEPAAETIEVAVDGAVTQPGVYELPAGSRVHHLLAVAGGYLDNADLSAINQAALLVDGQRLFVPARSTPRSVAPVSSPAPESIDLNRATAEELDRLPGIGPVKAAAIVDYRNQHGPFAQIEELLLVDGITQKLLEAIEPFLVITP